MANSPQIRIMKRNGEYRRYFLSQPHLAMNPHTGLMQDRCPDVYRPVAIGAAL